MDKMTEWPKWQRWSIWLSSWVLYIGGFIVLLTAHGIALRGLAQA